MYLAWREEREGPDAVPPGTCWSTEKFQAEQQKMKERQRLWGKWQELVADGTFKKMLCVGYSADCYKYFKGELHSVGHACLPMPFSPSASSTCSMHNTHTHTHTIASCCAQVYSKAATARAI